MALSFQDKIKPVATTTPSFMAKAKPVVAKEPTLLEKLGKRYTTAVEGQSLNPIRNNVRIAGGVAGGINDILGAVIEPVFNKVTDTIGSIPAVQKFAMAKPVANTLDTINSGLTSVSNAGKTAMSALPTKTQQDLRDAGNIVSLLPIGKGAQVTAKVAEPALKPVLTGVKNAVVKTPEATVAKRANEILNIENNYANTRKANRFSKDAGAESRKRVAYTDVLVDAVDENGLLRTKQPGGAYEKYKAETIDGREGVVRSLLQNEGKVVNLADVENKLYKTVINSGLEGADLDTALNNIKKEVKGYALKADAQGNVPLTLIHDAKISTTQGINFLTEPNVKVSKKSVAKGLKEIIEENSAENVKEINGELAKYYNDLDLIERLDGKRVKGGKLGKFTSQVGGGIVGTGVGAMVGGPIGAAVGGYVGSQLAEKIKGKTLSKTLGKATGLKAPESQILKDAYSRSKNDSTILNTKNPKIPAPIIDIPPTIPSTVQKSSTLPVNKKLEAFKSGKPSSEGGYILNPLANTRKAPLFVSLPKSISQDIKLKVAKELESYDSTPLKVNGKIDLSNSDIEFRLDELKAKNANGTFTDKDAIEAKSLLKKMGIDVNK